MDDNIFGNLEIEGREFPELEPNQVWAGKLELTIVKFPSPVHVEFFFKFVHALIAKLCETIGIDIVDSTTAVGIAMKKSDIPGNDMFKPDISKYKN
jgi:hypothetical protein